MAFPINQTGRNNHQFKHGQTLTPEYYSWKGMLSRCFNTNTEQYLRYGARGVTVCDRWRGADGFQNFFIDMGARPAPHYSIDRFPNSAGNYEPTNCRWATKLAQTQNRSNTVIATIGSETHTIKEWSDRTGLPYARLLNRFSKGLRGHALIAKHHLNTGHPRYRALVQDRRNLKGA